MSVQENYPHLWAFFHGAFQANSGGFAQEEDFNDIIAEELKQAEDELEEFCRDVDGASWLGMQADSGYTVYMDEQKMMAFELLDRRY